MAQLNVEKEVIKGIVDLIRNKQFYGHILQQLSKVYIKDKDSPLSTLAVGKYKDEQLIKLFVNEHFVRDVIYAKDRNEDEAWDLLVAALEHEVLHVVFSHLTLEFSDRERSAVAVDCVVNSCIENIKYLDGIILPEQFGFEKHKSAQWYYNNLRDNEQFEKMRQNMQGQGDGDGDGSGQGQGQGKSGGTGKNGMGDLKESMDSHKMWEEAMKDPLLKDFVKDIIRQAKDLCNGDYGSIPGEVMESVNSRLKKKKAIVPWNKVLRSFCASATESELSYTMKRESNRYGTRPGIKKEDILSLCVCVDTSGSVSAALLEIFFNEIKWIYKNGATITIYEADTRVTRDYKFKGKFKGDVTGRGGTHLEPAIAQADKCRKFDAMIYFTDFYAPKIEKKYKIPILWVLTDDMPKSQYPYKWGRHVKIHEALGNRY